MRRFIRRVRGIVGASEPQSKSASGRHDECARNNGRCGRAVPLSKRPRSFDTGDHKGRPYDSTFPPGNADSMSRVRSFNTP